MLAARFRLHSGHAPQCICLSDSGKHAYVYHGIPYAHADRLQPPVLKPWDRGWCLGDVTWQELQPLRADFSHRLAAWIRR